MAEKAAGRWEWLPGAATVCSIVACYGTLAVVGVLSVMGVGIALNEGAWAGVISLFAVIAAAGIAFGYRRHGVAGLLALAVVGASLVLWVMFGSFNRVLEIAGFAALVVATVWDWRAKKSRRDG